jgi:hypothetical protein
VFLFPFCDPPPVLPFLINHIHDSLLILILFTGLVRFLSEFLRHLMIDCSRSGIRGLIMLDLFLVSPMVLFHRVVQEACKRCVRNCCKILLTSVYFFGKFYALFSIKN